MKISVVIPVLNEAKYLNRCLEALMRQSVKSDEVVVVDNGSTDASIEIAKKYHVRVLREPRRGRAPARTTGFDASRYEIIGRIDADTVVPADWVELVRRHFESDEQLAGLTGPAYAYDFLYPLLKWRFLSRWYLRSCLRLFGHTILWGSNMAVRKTIWNQVRDKVSLDDRLVHEDQDVSALIAKAGGKMIVDWDLEVGVSSRRFHSPFTVIEYFNRRRKTLRHHGIKM